MSTLYTVELSGAELQLLQGTWRQWVGELDIKDVSAWLGHSDISVTQRHYAALSKDSLTNRVQRVLRSRPFNESGEL
jgi:integrase